MATRAGADRPDAFVFLVGPKGSGKSSVRNRCIFPEYEAPKPGSTLEFTYARINSRADKKDVANIWEFCGPKEVVDSALANDRLFLSAGQVATAVVRRLALPGCQGMPRRQADRSPAGGRGGGSVPTR